MAQVTLTRSPFPPGTTTYMQVGDAGDGLGDGDAGLGLVPILGALAGGYVGYGRFGIPGAIGAGYIGKTFPRLTLAYLAFISLV